MLKTVEDFITIGEAVSMKIYATLDDLSFACNLYESLYRIHKRRSKSVTDWFANHCTLADLLKVGYIAGVRAERAKRRAKKVSTRALTGHTQARKERLNQLMAHGIKGTIKARLTHCKVSYALDITPLQSLVIRFPGLPKYRFIAREVAQ